MSKVFITGANGLLGTNTIIELLASGYEVKALVRNKNKFLLPAQSGLEVLEGDLSQNTFPEKALQDCRVLIHAAAETAQDLAHYADYAAVNVIATKRLYTAAANAGIKRLIHVSSSNVFGFGTAADPGNEDRAITKPFSDSLYVRSKVESQQIALSFSHIMDVMIVNPTFMIGAYDQKPGSGRIILFGYNKKILFFPPGGKNFVDVKDVAQGILSVIHKGRNKESYLFSGENLSYKEFFERLRKHTEIQTKLIPIPCFVLLLAGLFGNVQRAMGIKTEVSRTNMNILCIKNYYSNTKAKTELGLDFEKINGAIEDALNWFKLKGIIKN